MTELKKNQLVTIDIDNYTSEGDGVGRVDGRAIFVKGALRGERVEAQILKVAKTCAWARVNKVITASPARQQPDCPYYAKCGGCRTRHMTYAEELVYKEQRVNDALRRLGGFDVTVTKIMGAEQPDRYRNKAAFPVALDNRSSVCVGFYRERSHDVTDIPACLIQSDQADKAGRILRKWMNKYKVPAYDESNGKGLIRHLIVRTNRRRQSLICIVANGKELPFAEELVKDLTVGCPKTVGIVLNVNTLDTNVILGREYHTLWGVDYLEDRLCGLNFRLSVPSFFQVNRDQAEVLYRQAVDYAGLTGEEVVVDLYCGTGTITLAMAQKAKKVIGVEVVAPAIRDAKENARRNGFDNVLFLCADAGEAAKKLVEQGIRPDVLSVDPPRKGLDGSVIEAIAEMMPKKVVYVSCDPATLARDLKLLREKGYELMEGTAVDMFPRTAHVETCVLLSHKEVSSYIEVTMDFNGLKVPEKQPKPTYRAIQDYIESNYGFKVHTSYIAEVKRSFGLDMYDAPNAVDELKQPRKHPTPEKVEAITEALRHFGVIN